MSIVFLGSKLIGYRSLEAVAVTCPDELSTILTLDDRDSDRSAFEKFQEFGSKSEASFTVIDDRKEAEDILYEESADLCVVVGWYWLIDEKLLRSIPRGFIGIHNSLLPKYRGGAPLNWAIINGDEKTGVTLFSFSEGMDDGPIWDQREFCIEDDDYIKDLLEKARDASENLIASNLEFILSGEYTPVEQDESEATYGAQRIPADGKIEWSWTSNDVYNFIRAQSKPYPGAYSRLDGEKIKIWKAEKVNEKFHGTPGQVAKVSDCGVYVICGDSRPLLVKTVQRKKEEPQPAQKIIDDLQYRLS